MATNSVNTSRLDELGLLHKGKPASEKKELGQDEFLELMTAQLQNQDPFKPLENGEFLGQIAQFSSVRGIQELKTTFENLAASLQSNQALQAGGLVGKDVLVGNTNGQVAFTGDPIRGVIQLPERADSVELALLGPTGETVARVDLGAQPKGATEFEWDGSDGKGNAVPPGVYQIKANARVGGEAVGAETLLVARVESVSLGRGQEGLTLNLAGLGARDFSEVREIR